MTTRRYDCEVCGIFDVKQSIKDEPLRFCPNCGGTVHQKYFAEPLADVWITDSPYVHNGTIHRFIQRGGTSGFNRKIR